jgi:hypothetical protein
MKNILKLSALLLALSVAFICCKEKDPLPKPFLTVDETPITATAEAGIYTIAVSSNGEWTAVVENAEDHAWLSLTKTNDSTITVNVAENLFFETRSATLKITLGNLTKSVVINQEAAEEIIEYPIEIPFEEYCANRSCWIYFSHPPQWLPWHELIIINNSEELEQYLICINDCPEIDFSKHTLLLARGWTHCQIIEISRKHLLQLSKNDYKLEINILLSNATLGERWVVPLIVDKLNEESNVELKVTM